MSKSLQDQLLNAGLVTKNQAKKVKSDNRKQTKQQQKNRVIAVDNIKTSAQQELAEKTARDRKLNQKKQQQAEQKSIIAQIRQLIEANQLPQDPEGTAYHFSDDNLVKTLYVSDAMRSQISSGKAAIVKLEKKYHVVPHDVATKISQRNSQCVVQLNERQETKTDTDDPYADFQVPDDLMW